jgi:drug/metabolite transporter (DMT)-like permease
MFDRFKPSHWKEHHIEGIFAALTSAVVLGFAPILGKQAISAGVNPVTVVMLRTVIAAFLLWIAYLLFLRKYIYVYPFGLVGCVLAGLVNGTGSLMYYNGLSHLDASLAQLLYTLYPIFLTILSKLDGHAISRLTVFRISLGLVAVVLLRWSSSPMQPSDLYGAFLMIASGAMYALHLAINQRSLYEVPAPTVTLYTLTTMALTVTIGYAVSGTPPLPTTGVEWTPIILLTLTTLVSRLMLFVGVKRLGGTQAVLISLSESLVAVLAAIFLLGEHLTPIQWGGALLLGLSVFLVTQEKTLGEIPRPKPWIQIFTEIYTDVHLILHPPTKKKIEPPPEERARSH